MKTLGKGKARRGIASREDPGARANQTVSMFTRRKNMTV